MAKADLLEQKVKSCKTMQEYHIASFNEKPARRIENFICIDN
jgi:hypothetical protein